MFCYSCITKWLEKNAICPMDRRTVGCFDDMQEDQLVNSILDEFDIYCYNRSNGCSVSGLIADVNEHLTECKYSSEANVEARKYDGLQANENLLEEYLVREDTNSTLASRVYTFVGKRVERQYRRPQKKEDDDFKELDRLCSLLSENSSGTKMADLLLETLEYSDKPLRVNRRIQKQKTSKTNQITEERKKEIYSDSLSDDL